MWPHCSRVVAVYVQGAQGNRSRLLQGTFYDTGIMVPYMCVIVGCHRNVGIDTTNSERVWKDMSREETETKKLNRNNFFSVDTHRSGVLSCRTTHHQRRQEQRASAAHPRPEAPPRAGGAGDLGPATAESSARGRAGSQLDHVPSAPPPPWRAY